jgi:hypothetical protein
MRRIAVLGLVAAVGCASGSTSTTSRPQTMRVVGQGGLAGSQVSMTASSTSSTTKLDFPLEAIWRSLAFAYDSLKIPITTIDPKRHLFGNEGMKVRQKLGNVMLSKYIDCGQAQIGPSADSYDVYMEVTTTVRSISAGQSEVSTLVTSAAKPLTFGQEYSSCQTKGTIETAISSIVAAKAAAR